MNKLCYHFFCFSMILISSCGEKKTDTKTAGSNSMIPDEKDTTEEMIVPETEIKEGPVVVAADTAGLSVAFEKFKKSVLKRDTASIRKMMQFPLADMNCLISFNPKLQGRLGAEVNEKNWGKFYNDIFSTKIVKLISHSDVSHFTLSKMDNDLICTLVLAEKAADENGAGEGSVYYVFSYKTPSTFVFRNIGCAGGSVSDRDIINR